MTALVLIAALDRCNAIGKGNALPWHLPADLKRFKALTMAGPTPSKLGATRGSPLLMGRRTAESLGRVLPGRTNLVLTRSGQAPFAGMQAVASLDEALACAREENSDELCVIGGGEIYALCLPRATRMHLTHVDTVVADADAFFPNFDAAQWRIAARESHAADAKHAFAFEFVDYVRA